MDSNRFRRRDYSNLPSRKPAAAPPVVDGIDQAKPQSTPPVISQNQPEPNSVPHYSELTPQNAQPVQQASQPARPQPVWAQPRSANVAPESVATVGATPASTTINVNLSLPKLKKPKVPRVKLSKKAKIISLVIVVLVILSVAGYFGARHFMKSTPEAALKAGAGQTAVANPTFTPVAPSEKSQLASASSAGTGFDGTRDVYSYNDTLSGTGITVSQQPLPTGAASPQAAIDKVAKSIGATTPVSVPNGTKGYLADSHSGNQVVVFTVHNLLVFIQSPFTHTASDYQIYIANLK